MTTVSDRPVTEATTLADQKMTIVSSDGHVGPSLRYNLRDYVEAKHLDNLDLGVLSQVGERVGPTFGELMEPYTGFPEGAVSATCAFRDVGFLS